MPPSLSTMILRPVRPVSPSAAEHELAGRIDEDEVAVPPSAASRRKVGGRMAEDALDDVRLDQIPPTDPVRCCVETRTRSISNGR